MKKYLKKLCFFSTFSAMSLFASFMVLLLILVEVAPPSAASVPRLGMISCFIAGSLEAAYSLNWGAREIWGKGGGEILALL